MKTKSARALVSRILGKGKPQISKRKMARLRREFPDLTKSQIIKGWLLDQKIEKKQKKQKKIKKPDTTPTNERPLPYHYPNRAREWYGK
tara:strand:+ start:2003 stop:2269 length:267 start_codon:yes stop_codon:yes gene_type:complete